MDGGRDLSGPEPAVLLAGQPAGAAAASAGKGLQPAANSPSSSHRSRCRCPTARSNLTRRCPPRWNCAICRNRSVQVRVLDRVSLAVRAGETAAIIGPSGGGKSTMLRCVNPPRGTGWRRSADFRRAIPTCQRIPGEPAACPHADGVPALQPVPQNRTALGNVIEAQMVVLKRSRAEAEAKAQLVLRRVGLSHKLDAYPQRLSGGEAAACGDRPAPWRWIRRSSCSTSRPAPWIPSWSARCACDHGGSGRRGHDDAGRDARDELRQAFGRQGLLLQRRPHRPRKGRRIAFSMRRLSQ